MDANQEKAEADRKTDKEEIKTGHKELLAKMQELMKMIQAYQAKTYAFLPTMRVTETSHKGTAAAFKPANQVKTVACQEMEAYQKEKEPTSAGRNPEATKQREGPVDDAELMPVGEPKKKLRKDRKLAAQHRRQKPKTSTRENCGPKERLAVYRRGTSHRSEAAQKMQADKKVPRRATVARRMREIFRPNTTSR
jgi:hypothetical protein